MSAILTVIESIFIAFMLVYCLSRFNGFINDFSNRVLGFISVTSALIGFTCFIKIGLNFVVDFLEGTYALMSGMEYVWASILSWEFPVGIILLALSIVTFLIDKFDLIK